MAISAAADVTPAERKPLYKLLYVQVLTAIVLGFSLLPALLTLGSLWWLRRYSLDARTVDARADDSLAG